MVKSVEVLIPRLLARTGTLILESLMRAAAADGMRTNRTTHYTGDCDVLMLYGVGDHERDIARRAQIACGGHAILWDFGYVGRQKFSGYMRVSVDSDHPQQYLDATTSDPARFNAFGIALREDFDPNGHIVLVAMSQKMHQYLGAAFETWDRDKVAELRQRFPGRRIIYRPKPNRQYKPVDCFTDSNTPIAELLRGASLVVAHVSAVCVDAVIAGVPFECADGAATWLNGKPYTAENRLDFLRRLAWWQWNAGEGSEAWAFLRGVIEKQQGDA